MGAISVAQVNVGEQKLQELYDRKGALEDRYGLLTVKQPSIRARYNRILDRIKELEDALDSVYKCLAV